MSIRIDDNQRKALKIIASVEGKTMGGIVSELIDGYLNDRIENMKNNSAERFLVDIMKLSENSFMEWDNEEDEIYNSL